MGIEPAIGMLSGFIDIIDINGSLLHIFDDREDRNENDILHNFPSWEWTRNGRLLLRKLRWPIEAEAACLRNTAREESIAVPWMTSATLCRLQGVRHRRYSQAEIALIYGPPVAFPISATTDE